MTIYSHCVYWIHLDSDTDILSQGYVGVTSNPKRRLREHLKESKSKTPKNLHLARALSKYQAKMTIIYHGIKESCYELEFILRPQKQIAWNIQKGGKILTDANIQKRSNTLTGRVFSKEHCERLSNAKTGINNPQYGKKIPCSTERRLATIRGKNNLESLLLAIQLLESGTSIRKTAKLSNLGASSVLQLKQKTHSAFDAFPELSQFKTS